MVGVLSPLGTLPYGALRSFPYVVSPTLPAPFTTHPFGVYLGTAMADGPSWQAIKWAAIILAVEGALDILIRLVEKDAVQRLIETLVTGSAPITGGQ